jgi:hypothetical protein
MRGILIAGAAVLSLALAGPAVSDAFAKGPGGGGPPGLSRGVSSGFSSRAVNSRGRQAFASTNRPPGWSRGQKRGWLRGNCTTIGSANCIPPGLR